MDNLSPVPDGDPSSGGSAAGDEHPGQPGLSGLLARCARGDEAAFARLYDATAAKVYGLAVRVLRDPAQAEEVTQEAFWEIWRTSARYRSDRGSPLAWMLTITHRRAVDRVRSEEAAERREKTYHERNRTVDHDATAEAAQSSMDSRRVRTALETLTAVQREAVVLSYLGGYSHTEIAALLDLPVGTAKTRIRDGLIRLRDTLGVGMLR